MLWSGWLDDHLRRCTVQTARRRRGSSETTAWSPPSFLDRVPDCSGRHQGTHFRRLRGDVQTPSPAGRVPLGSCVVVWRWAGMNAEVAADADAAVLAAVAAADDGAG